MKFLNKKFRRIFLATVLFFGVALISSSYFSAKEYYSKFTSWEDFNQIVESGEVIPNGTMLLGAGSDTILFLTTIGAGSWVVPNDWNNLSNKVELLGGGGSGGGSSSRGGSGGGGGAYSKKNNLSLTVGSSVSYFVGGISQDTWFSSTTIAMAKGGAGGNPKSSTDAGGVGGQASASVGDTKYNGGNGGNSCDDNGAGGGGAAGLNGAGNAGSIGYGCGSGNGGRGDVTFGGLGGVTDGVINGGAGTEWQVSPARGSGGGGGSCSNSCNTGSGGLYGGGGAGKNTTNSGFSAGQGAQGIIVITYLPLSAGGFNFFFF